jgi:uncharacterized protein YegL
MRHPDGFRRFISLAACCAALLLAAHDGASAQPTLNFKRVINNWPTIELYYMAGCNGQPLYVTDTSKITVMENGIRITDFRVWCPSPSMQCALSTALVFDASGSMTGTAMAGAKAAGHSWVDALDGVIDQSAILWFNSTVTTQQGMTESKDLLHAAINAIPTGGSTAVWDAAYQGVLEVINSGVNQCRAVIVLTDGADAASSRQPAEIISLANRNRVRVFTIGIGSGINSAQLQSLANLTGGRYYEAPNTSQLTTIFQEIRAVVAQGFQECLITYTASCMDGSTRTVDLTIHDICNGSDTKSKTFKALRDTSTFISLRIDLPELVSRGSANVAMPLQLLDPVTPKTLLYPAEFVLLFDSNCTQYTGITTPPGSLLEGVPITVTPIAGGIIFETRNRKTIEAVAAGAVLAELGFKARTQPGNDTMRCAVSLATWNFTAGCFRPVLSDGEIVYMPPAPDLSCSVTIPDSISWSPSLRAYSPDPFTAGVTFANTGNFEARNVRARLIYDARNLTLHAPANETQYTTPDTIPGAGNAAASWELHPLPRLYGDTVHICFSGMSDNHPLVSCCRSVWIPAIDTRILAVPSTSICQNDSVRLSAPPGLASYLWNTGDTGQSILVRQAGLYWCRLQDTHVRQRYTDTVQVTVLQPPQPAATPPGPIQLCEGGTVWLSVVGDYRSYRWSSGDTTQRISVTRSGTYSAAVIDSNGCHGTTNGVVVTVVPTRSVSITGSPAACLSVTQIYRSAPADSVTKVWFVSSGGQIAGSAYADSVVVLWNAPGAQWVAIVQTDERSGCAATDTLRVTVGSSLEPRITVVGSTSLCAGDSVTLDAGAGFASYLWSTGSTDRSIVVAQPGSFSVFVTDAQGCSGRSDTVTVVVHPAPAKPSITQNGNVLTATAGPWAYQWSRDGGDIPGATTNTLTVTASGSYRVTVTDSNGCSSTSDPLQITVGIETPAAAALAPELYPDPASDAITLRVPSQPGETVRITVSDLLGRVLVERVETSAGDAVRCVMTLAPAPPGTYIVVIASGAQRWTRTVRLY